MLRSRLGSAYPSEVDILRAQYAKERHLAPRRHSESDKELAHKEMRSGQPDERTTIRSERITGLELATLLHSGFNRRHRLLI